MRLLTIVLTPPPRASHEIPYRVAALTAVFLNDAQNVLACSLSALFRKHRLDLSLHGIHLHSLIEIVFLLPLLLIKVRLSLRLQKRVCSLVPDVVEELNVAFVSITTFNWCIELALLVFQIRTKLLDAFFLGVLLFKLVDEAFLRCVVYDINDVNDSLKLVFSGPKESAVREYCSQEFKNLLL